MRGKKGRSLTGLLSEVGREHGLLRAGAELGLKACQNGKSKRESE